MQPSVIDVYARISQAYDGTTRSVDSQVDECVAEVEDHAAAGWTLGMIFKDHALSGWNPKIVRPDFNQLMHRLETGQSQGVCLSDLTRFTRKPMEGERLIMLADRGIIVHSATLSYDLRKAEQRKQFRDAMTAAAHESDKISERSTRGNRLKAKRGRNVAHRPGFGMMRHGPKPEGWVKGDPMQAMITEGQLLAERQALNMVVDKLLAGESLTRCAAELTEMGHRTEGGGVFTNALLRQMLRRATLAGKVVYQRTVVGENAFDTAAIDPEKWERLQTLFDGRSRGRPATAYLLSGLIFCSWCGCRLYGRPRYNKADYEDGTPARDYWCAKKPLKGCGRTAMDTRFAEDIVSAAVVERLSQPQYRSKLSETQVRLGQEREGIVTEINEINRALAIYDEKLLTDPHMTAERYNAATAKVGPRLSALQAKLHAVGEPTALEITSDVGYEWEVGDLAKRRALIRTAFPRLTILPSHDGRGGRRTSLERFDWEGRAHPLFR